MVFSTFLAEFVKRQALTRGTRVIGSEGGKPVKQWKTGILATFRGLKPDNFEPEYATDLRSELGHPENH